MERPAKLKEFVGWVDKNITGDEKGQAQIYLDRLFQAFGQPGSLDVGGTPEFRIRKSSEDGGGTWPVTPTPTGSRPSPFAGDHLSLLL